MDNTNSKFKRILVAVDDEPCSEKAILYAKEMAAVFGASIALVTVVPPTSPANFGADPLLGQQPIIVPEVSEMEQDNAQKYLEKISREFTGAGEVYLLIESDPLKKKFWRHPMSGPPILLLWGPMDGLALTISFLVPYPSQSFANQLALCSLFPVNVTDTK